jgi:hypothetical protein
MMFASRIFNLKQRIIILLHRFSWKSVDSSMWLRFRIAGVT